MLGGEEKQIDFQNQIPVHITYQTAFVDEAGKLQFRDDIYGLDAKLMSILKGSERQVADVAIERPADPNFKPTPEQGQRLRSAAGGGGGSPFGAVRPAFPLKPAENPSKRAGFPDPALNLVNNRAGFRRPFFAILARYDLLIGGGGTVIPH